MWLGWLWTKGDSVMEKRLRHTNRQLWARATHFAEQYQACYQENREFKAALHTIANIDETTSGSPIEGLLQARETARQALAMSKAYYNNNDF